jgi:DNA invertase Pin-like site-specific DNA recombinase
MIAFYVRFSTDKKDKDKKQDATMQLHALKEYMSKRCLTDFDITIYQENKGVSGADNDRQKLNELLNDVRSGKIKHVLAYDTSRFSRDMYYLGYLFSVFQENDVVVETIADGVQSFDNPMAKLMAFIRGFVAEQERRSISERTKMKLKEVRANGSKSGKKIGGQLGNKNKRNKFSGITPEILQQLFSLRSQGMAYHKIGIKFGFSGPKVIRVLRRYSFRLRTFGDDIPIVVPSLSSSLIKT